MRAMRAGELAELAVADLLVARGFEIVARNLRLGALELDVVARRGPLVVVAEVRTRSPRSFEGPLESIGPAKRRRLARAVDRLWSARLAQESGVERVRIDAAAVTFAGRRTTVEYIDGAVSF